MCQNQLSLFLFCLLNCPKLPYVALYCPKLPYFALSCPTLTYVALSYPKVGLYCSKTESRVPCGWWVVVVVQTNNRVKPNLSCVELSCVRLFWGCLGVVLWLSCGFDNFSNSSQPPWIFPDCSIPSVTLPDSPNNHGSFQAKLNLPRRFWTLIDSSGLS